MDTFLTYSNTISFLFNKYKDYKNSKSVDENGNIIEKFSIGDTVNSIFSFLGSITYLVTAIVVAVLAWQCNADLSGTSRVIVTILAIIFAPWYMVYFAIWHVIMHKPCDKWPIEINKLPERIRPEVSRPGEITLPLPKLEVPAPPPVAPIAPPVAPIAPPPPPVLPPPVIAPVGNSPPVPQSGGDMPEAFTHTPF